MRKTDKHFIGIGFCMGGAVFSIINIFKIFTHANILHYDYIMTGAAVIFIILSLILIQKKDKEENWNIRYKFGLGFWIGGGVYSSINIIMNLKNTTQSNILSYNYIITGIAVIGLILNVILFKKGRNT